MTTHLSRSLVHCSRNPGKPLRGQTKRETFRFRVVARGDRDAHIFFGRLLEKRVRTSFPHTSSGQKRTFVTKNCFKFWTGLLTILVTLVCSAQPAFGHDPRVIAPARLDFKASRAPKDCNNLTRFHSILETRIPPAVLREDAERRLVVRIYRSFRGFKQVDVSLVDAQGVSVAEWHADHPAKTECHYVLWEAAEHAAQLLGAFEPPPPEPPVFCPIAATCPSCPVCPLCPMVRSCPTFSSLRRPKSTLTLPPMPYRSWIAMGASVNSGIYSKLDIGPQLLFGVAPSRHLSDLHIEIEGSWISQMSPSSASSPSIRVHAVPLVGSLCLARGIVRFCGGLATTMFFSNQSPYDNELLLSLAANVRVGTEWFVRGPFSARADVFLRGAFTQRRFGTFMAQFDDPPPIAAGLAVMGAWSAH